jgi:hypothetical protein
MLFLLESMIANNSVSRVLAHKRNEWRKKNRSNNREGRLLMAHAGL